MNAKNLKATGNTTLGGGAGTNVTIVNGTDINFGGNKLQNIGNGTSATDAVNYAQFQELSNRVNNMTGGVAPGVINNLNHRVTNVENRMNHLDRKVDKLEKKANAGIAGATAIASIPQVMQGGKSMIGVGAGTYEGKSAVALGWSRATDNGKAVIKLTGSANTEGKFSAGAGIRAPY